MAAEEEVEYDPPYQTVFKLPHCSCVWIVERQEIVMGDAVDLQVYIHGIMAECQAHSQDSLSVKEDLVLLYSLYPN